MLDIKSKPPREASPLELKRQVSKGVIARMLKEDELTRAKFNEFLIAQRTIIGVFFTEEEADALFLTLLQKIAATETGEK